MKSNFKDISTKIKKGQTVPISQSYIADVHSPISIYSKLKGDYSHSFLLESAEQGERIGRYSFLGFGASKHISFADGHAIIRSTIKTVDEETEVETQDPLELLKQHLSQQDYCPDPSLPSLQAGLVGYCSYDCVQYFDGINLPKEHNLKLPEMQFIIPEILIAFDNYQRRIYLISYLTHSGENLEAEHEKVVQKLEDIKNKLEQPETNQLLKTIESRKLETGTVNKPAYEASVLKALEKVKIGEIFQAVLSQQFNAETDKSSLEIYRQMRDINPSPYMYLFDFDDLSIIGSSPETLVKVEKNRILFRPIAGTRKRGKTAKEDLELARDLLSDEKEIAEHKMLVDLGRNDVGRVAKQGKVKVKNFMKVQKYSHVMHIVSDVVGELAADKTIFDAFKSCFPAGTLSGAPKIRAMQIISELETKRRGIYGGAVGYFDFSGNMDFAIAIRTIIKKGRNICAQAGAGIVFDSVPEREFQECINKAASSLASLS